MQEEISLREIIKVIWDGKWIIATITAIAVAITGIFSFFIVSPTYEAVSTVRVELSDMETVDQEQYLNSFAESLKTDVTMNRIINKLGLSRDHYSINSIRNSINVEVVENTNNMNIRVSGQEAGVITDISNLMAFELGARIEISDRSKRIVSARKSLESLEDSIKVNDNELQEAKKQLAETPEKLTTKKSLSDEAYLSAVISEGTAANERELGALQLESEEINPLYTSLMTKISEITLELTRQESNKLNYEQEIMEDNEIIANLEQQILKDELNMINSERMLSGFNAVFIAPAMEPNDPIAPNNVLNLAIAFVLGAMIGVFTNLFRHYMSSSAPVNNQKTIETN